MNGYEGGVRLQGTSNHMDFQNPTGAAVFDASQYAFFGNDVVEEVELGGLEEEDDLQPIAYEDEDFRPGNKEGAVVDSLSKIDDLASTFSKLNKVVSAPRAAGIIESKASGESSSAVEWAQRPDFPNWYNHQVINSDSSSEWSSHPHSSDANDPDPKLPYRTSSYPEPQQQQHHPHQHFSSEPILVRKTSFSSYRLPYHPGGTQMPLSSPILSPLSNHQFQLPALPNSSQFSRNSPQYNTPSLHSNNLPQNQWASQANMSLGDRSNSYNNLLQQQLPRPNGIMNPQLMQQRHTHPFRHPYGHLSGTRSPSLNHQFSPSPTMMSKFEAVLGWGDLKDQRTRSLPKVGQCYRYPHQHVDDRSGWPQFRSKYMSSDEIENILRIQLAATHSNDPYIDDYYHQARMAKKTSDAKLRHRFCPTYLRDLPPHARANSEPHAYLQVDALGRVAFPSIRRPRPLLEVDPPDSSINAGHNKSEKPLEQEPLLAARVAIEDGLCLLLDVEDIDRFLQFNPLQDGGAHLKNRRQALLDELAASLQLIDPLGKNGYPVVLAVKDDLVFLRVVSLPKGRKLLSKFLQLLVPNGELIRVVCMAIFRHLRFLFGDSATDPRAAESTINLGKNLSSCVAKMELKALSACLASMVCSYEHPPLQPIGSFAGDGVSVILKSLLERATELLTHHNEDGNCNGPNRAFWQASFDSFFGLLTKYCFSKYDAVMQSLLMQASVNDIAVIGGDAARAISKEIPVELLRASLPHTDENQRRVLMDFAQRTMPVNGGA